MKNKSRKPLYKKIASLLFPERCPLCLAPVKFGAICCGECENKLSEEPFRRMFSIDVGEEKLFYTTAPCTYDQIENYLWKLKFRNQKSYGAPLAELMAEAFKDFGSNFDFITCVPMGKKKSSERQYNHSEVLARELSKICKIKYIHTLKEIDKKHTQHLLSAKERAKNVKSAYKITDSIADRNIIHGKKILLADDIITSGSTICECAKMLYLAGAEKVSGICAADTR